MKLSKLTINSLLAVIIGFILLISPVFRFSWDLSVQTLTHILVLGCFLFVLNSSNLPFNKLKEGLFLVFLFAALLSFVKAAEKSMFIVEYLMLLSSILAAYVFNHLPDKEKMYLLHIPVLVGLWFSIVLLSTFIFNPLNYVMSNPVPPEFIINNNIAAGYLSLCFPISFIFWRSDKKLYYVLSLLLFIGVVLTKSRGAILACSIVGNVYLWQHKRWRNASLVIVTAVLLFLTMLKVKKYGFAQNYFLSDRVMWARAAFEMFKDNFLTGVGWGNFGNVYLSYRVVPGLNTIYAHNVFLQILAETGILGLVSFLAVITCSVSKYKPLLLAAIAFLIVNLISYSFYVPASMMLFWICLGSSFNGEFVFRHKPRIPHWIMGIVFLCMVFFIVKPYISSLYYERALLVDGKAEEYLLESAMHNPLSSMPYNKLAQVYFKRYNESKDSSYLEKSIEMELEAIDRFHCNPAFWSDLGWLYWTKGEKQEAFDSMKKAVGYDKFNTRYQKSLRMFKDSS